MEHTATVLLLDCQSLTDDDLAPFAAWLGPSEQQRLSRFLRPARRRQFLAGRTLLRQALTRLTGIPGPEVRLLERPGNAPLLDLPGSEAIGLSLSHSGDWVGCAVSATARLGLDVELIDESRHFGDLAAQAFDTAQQAWLAGRPATSLARDFYRLWGSAEARFKLPAPAAYEIVLAHPELSVVLCSAHPLARTPQLELAALEPASG